MMKCAALLAVLASVALATREPKIKDSKGWLREEILEVKPLVKLAKKTPKDIRNECIRLKSSNSGYHFQEAKEDDDNKVCLMPCPDGRNKCWKMRKGCDSKKCELCLRPFKCEDKKGSKRCRKIKECKCATGDFMCKPSNVGLRLKNSNVPKETPFEDETFEPGFTKNGYLGFFKKENCKSDDTFNMLPCNPQVEKCKAFEPCVSDDMSCCELVPGVSA